MRAYMREEDGTLTIKDVFEDEDGKIYYTTDYELVPTDKMLTLKGWPDSIAQVYRRRFFDGSLGEEWLIPAKPANLLTTNEAAEALGVNTSRVRTLIRGGRLKAEKAGRDWLIPEDALEAVRERRPGRPAKA